MSNQKWIGSSLRQLSKALQHQGHHPSPMSVTKVLSGERIRLRANNKCFTGPPHPDREWAVSIYSDPEKALPESRSTSH
jgi:hypothetical protein